ncbi:hypothetical protein ZWY2020_017825 [Hordeum vulgare]|nr:hypothetical protein ZWY2020_017825 [Hordeum vulgare]
MTALATFQGFDAAAVMSDLVFSSAGTDVIDVGSDLVNSEVMNLFLNVADTVTPGVVSEPVLRDIYDAYAATGARMLTQPEVARALGQDARKSPAQTQREADFDEVFDADFRTTGLSRPLDPEYACDGGEETCNHVRRFLDRQRQEDDLLGALWWSLVTGPLEYVRHGEVDEQREYHLAESSRFSPRVSSSKWSGCSPMRTTTPGR